MRRFLAFTLALVITAAIASPLRAASDSRLKIAACTVGDKKTPAECGAFTVLEDRSNPQGRTLPVAFVRIRALHPSGHAIVYEEGGPGGSGTAVAGFIADGAFEKYLRTLRDRYDLIFVDDRGIGKSDPFQCDWAPQARPAVFMGSLYPLDVTKACHDKYVNARNLNLYDTNTSADDLDELRAALGYKKIVLDGGSYGTTISLIFLRRHPSSVESEVLDGVAAPGFLPMVGAPLGAQRAMDDLFAACASDAPCAKRFPDVRRQFAALMKRFDAGPIDVPLRNHVTKKIESVPLSKEVLVDRLRQLTYDPENASTLPFIIAEAYHGNYRDLGALIAVISAGMDETTNLAANLNYACAEFMPFFTNEEIERQASRSYTGDLRIRAEQKACAIWNVAPMPASYNEPVRSSAPILMITGTADPATPPESAAGALRYLSNAKQILVEGGGHGNETPCIDKAVIAFVRAASPTAVNAATCSVPRAKTRFEMNADWLKRFE